MKTLTAFAFLTALVDGQEFRPQIPRSWDEEALKDWATPLAGLNARPSHMPAKEYYALPVENLKTYPVYFPGREPEGYWEMLQKVGPKPLIEPEKLKSEADWVKAGQVVFEEAPSMTSRSMDPKAIAAARSAETFAGVNPLPDGTIRFLGWLPTKDGLALQSTGACTGCHQQFTADGRPVSGAPSRLARPAGRGQTAAGGALRQSLRSPQILDGGGPFLMGTGPIGERRMREDVSRTSDPAWAPVRPATGPIKSAGGVPSAGAARTRPLRNRTGAAVEPSASESQPRPSISGATSRTPGRAASVARAASVSGRAVPFAAETRRCGVLSAICRRMRSWKPERRASEITSAATPIERPAIEIAAISATCARLRDAAR